MNSRIFRIALPLLAVVSFPAAQTRADDSFDLLAAAGGSYFNHKISGTTLYVGHELNLGVYDLSGGAPVAVKHVPLGPERGFGGMAAEGGALAVGGDGNGVVEIFDISTPLAPVFRANYVAQNSPFINNIIGPMAIEGNLLAIQAGYGQSGDGDIHLEIVDIASLSTPTLVGRYDLWPDNGGPNDSDAGVEIEFVGDRVYIGGARGLTIINVADPAHPAFLARMTVSSSNTIRYLAVGGGKAAALTQLDDLLVYDVSNPASPSLISSSPLGSDFNPAGLAGLANGIDVYVAQSSTTSNDVKLTRYSLADPTDPAQVGGTSTISGESLLGFEAGPSAVVAVGANDYPQVFRLHAYEPSIGGLQATGGFPLIPRIDAAVLPEGIGSPVFYSFGNVSTYVITVPDPLNPIPRVSHEQPSFGYGFEVSGSQRVGFQSYEALLYEDDPSIQFAGFYDLSDSLHPRRAATLRLDTDDPNSPHLIPGVVSGNKSFHAAGNLMAVVGNTPNDPTFAHKIELFDITDINAPAKRSIFGLTPDGGDVVSAAIVMDRLILAGFGPEPDYSPRLVEWNIADPASPSFVGDYEHASPSATEFSTQADVSTFFKARTSPSQINFVRYSEFGQFLIERGITADLGYAGDMAIDSPILYLTSTSGAPGSGRIEAIPFADPGHRTYFSLDAPKAALLTLGRPRESDVGDYAVEVYSMTGDLRIYRHEYVRSDFSPTAAVQSEVAKAINGTIELIAASNLAAQAQAALLERGPLDANVDGALDVADVIQSGVDASRANPGPPQL